MRRPLAATALLAAAVLVSLSVWAGAGCASSDSGSRTGGAPTLPGATGDAILARAFEDRSGDLQVDGQGAVVTILADDTDRDRHQRFIVRLESGQTLLIAHNIDLAPRVEDLRVGDTVAFRGVYEWSAQGGTIHWTHHDPDGEHTAGWIRHRGHTVK